MMSWFTGRRDQKRMEQVKQEAEFTLRFNTHYRKVLEDVRQDLIIRFISLARQEQDCKLALDTLLPEHDHVKVILQDHMTRLWADKAELVTQLEYNQSSMRRLRGSWLSEESNSNNPT